MSTDISTDMSVEMSTDISLFVTGKECKVFLEHKLTKHCTMVDEQKGFYNQVLSQSK